MKAHPLAPLLSVTVILSEAKDLCISAGTSKIYRDPSLRSG